MKTSSSSKTSDAAFTLTELIVVMVCVAMLAMLVLPALAGTRSHSAIAGCLANLRRLQIGAEMYRVENADTLIPNAPAGAASSQVWCGGSENWGSSAANIDPAFYTNSILIKYLQNDLSILRCPADVIPSANGPRIRSYSMNGQMGYTSRTYNYNTGWRTYAKGSDLVCPTPAGAFVFLDESPYSLNDSFCQSSLSTPNYADIPAAYLDGGCGFSFADGHAEYRKWLWHTADPKSGILNVPHVYGITGSGTYWGSSGMDVDWIWLRQHAACPN